MQQSDRDLILKDIDRQINNLPPFSPIIDKVLKIIDNPASSASDIEKVIKYDQVLASRVLRMANSAYYGYSGKISTISQAVVILGLNTLRAILFTASAAKTLNKKLVGYKLDEGGFWKHSVLCALASRAIATKIKYQNIEEVFIGGLLHDLGKLILDPFVAKNYKAIIDIVNAKKISFSQAEGEVIGINHAQVGRRLSEKWNFPSNLVEIIAFHHRPEGASVNKIPPAIVSISTKFATYMASGIDSKTVPLNFEFSLSTLSILNIEQNSLKELYPLVGAAFKDASTFLGM